MPVVVDLTASNMEDLPCCGIRNPEHAGRIRKNCWLRRYLKKGLRAKALLTEDDRPCGYIEYLPGKYAWRGVNAAGYMFIHCIWTYFRRYQHRGLGGELLRGCLEDAERAGTFGVAAIARNAPWLAGPELFLKNGYATVDTAPPDYTLLVRKLDPNAPDPSFKTGWDEKAARYGRGLTIVRSDQCSHIAKFADEIADTAWRDYGHKPRIVELKSYREAQNAPTPYAVFSILYDGRVIADHQISRTRFHNIMRKLK